MARFHYEQSAYGYSWEKSKEADTVEELYQYQTPLWLKVLAERHHRIVDTNTGEVVWYHGSKIAPKPGTKKGSIGR